MGGLNRFSRNRPNTDNQGATKRSVSLGRSSLAPGKSESPNDMRYRFKNERKTKANEFNSDYG